MAKGRDERKETVSKGKSKAERHSATTEANKHRNINRQTTLALRKDKDVSANCLKSRQKRRRLEDYRAQVKAGVKFLGSPSELGERQFQNRKV